jgi:hypothetical protein
MGRGRWAKGRASGRPSWVEKAGLAIAAVGVIVAIAALLISSGSSSGESNPTSIMATRPGQLDAVDVQIHDVSPFEGGRAYLEVTLHNVGERLIVIDGAQVEVQRLYKLRRCASQGDIVLSHIYGLSLPATAREGQKFKASLHQQVGPDEADRFRIEFSTKLPKSDQTSVYLFEIKVRLQDDGAQPDLPLGTAVVALPELPSPGEYYWDSSTHKVLRELLLTSPDYLRYIRRFAMPCWLSNTVTLKNVDRGNRVVSDDLKGLVSELVPPSINRLE